MKHTPNPFSQISYENIHGTKTFLLQLAVILLVRKSFVTKLNRLSPSSQNPATSCYSKPVQPTCLMINFNTIKCTVTLPGVRNHFYSSNILQQAGFTVWSC